MNPMPQPGQVYRHFKGGAYVVLGVGLLESPYGNVVIYQPVNGGQVWVRLLTAWNKAVGDVDWFTLLSTEEAEREFAHFPDAPRFSPFNVP